MAKNNQGKVVTMLSPENYIRQRARTLPLYECWINGGWQEGNMAHIAVARQHITGNITFGLYLIDLNCLGVKDAHFLFNVFPHEYKEVIEEMKKQIELEQAPYPLVHNIIYAALEFAEDNGFKPHKDFSVAQFILAEDNDEIELMDIPCGDNGVPVYFRGPNDSDAFAKRVLKTLETNVGKDNYFYVDSYDSDFDEDEDDEDDESYDKYQQYLDQLYEKMAERFRKLSFKEKVEVVKKVALPEDNLTFDEKEEYLYLKELIFDELQDNDLIAELHDKIFSPLDDLKVSRKLSDKMLGIVPGTIINRSKTAKRFQHFYDLDVSEAKIAGQQFAKLHQEIPNNPAVHFLEIHYLQKIQSDDLLETLHRYYEKFPDYPLLKILWRLHSHRLAPEGKPPTLEALLPAVFFPDYTEIHKMELYHYIEMLTLIAAEREDVNELAVVEMLIEDFLDDNSEDSFLIKLIDTSRLKIIYSLDE